MSAAPQGQAGAATEPPVDARPWSRQWGLEFVGPSGAANRDLERRFWATRATWQQTTAAVLSAGAVAGRHRHYTTSGRCGQPWTPRRLAVRHQRRQAAAPLGDLECPGSAAAHPGSRFSTCPAGVALVHGLLAFKLYSQGQTGLVSRLPPAHIALQQLPPGPSSPAVERETTRSACCLAHSSCCPLAPVLTQIPRRLPGLLPFPRRPTQQPPPRYSSCSCGCWLCWRRMPSHACAR